MPPRQQTKETRRPGAPLKAGISTVPKMWHHFLVKKNFAILNGTHSQGHKRYKDNNLQGASVCVMACAYCKIAKMELWTQAIVDQILERGSLLHLKSLQYLENKCSLKITPPKVYKYFFIEDIRFTMKINPDSVKATLRLDQNPPRTLRQILFEFLVEHESGVFVSHDKYFAIWKADGFFLYDPIEHDLDGNRWAGVPGQGYSYVMRYQALDDMAATILNNIKVRYNTRIQIYPCSIEKMVKINTKPPDIYDPQQPPPPLVAVATSKTKIPTKKQKAHPAAPQLEKPPEGDGEIKGPREQDIIPDLKTPLERPTLKDMTHFIGMSNGTGAILRASTHQCDPKFSKYKGKQTMGNAVAALVMLRRYKAKNWVRRILDDVLKLGEMVHHQSHRLPLHQICERITLEDKDYAPEVEHHALMGKLRSTRDDLLDLQPALVNFLLDNDACILVGPVTVAIWSEDNHYYMFDPNERNDMGGTKGCPPGVACVTRFATIKDLVDTYTSNLDNSNNKDYFYFSKCIIRDYVDKADPWYNFSGISPKKWILRGTFCQADRRFPKESRNTQCTANATMALVYTELKEEKDWNTDTVDQVLLSGDDFYRNSVNDLKERNKFSHPMLMVDELKRNFPIADKEVNLEIEDCLVNGIINAKSETGVLNLRKGFEEFFSNNESGVLTSHGLSTAVWRRGKIFYYFDSHSRDGRGVVCNLGTACILRVLNVDDLASTVLTNLGPDAQDLYNISRICVKLLDITEEGVVKPPLNNFIALNEFVGILRSNLSEKDTKFDLNRGKQTIPMCLSALGYNTLTPSGIWSQDDIDQVLIVGDAFYVQAMEANLGLDLPEEEDVDDITTNNVKTDFKIGLNKFDVEMQTFAEGKIGTNLQEALNNLNEQPLDDGESEENKIAKFQSILESEFIKASLWRDDNLYYLFDPKARDENGQVIGKDDWTVIEAEVIEPEEDKEEDIDEKGGGDNFGDQPEGDGFEAVPADNEEEAVGVEEEEERVTNMNDYEMEGDEEVAAEAEEEEEEQEQERKLVEKHSLNYWRQKEEAGKGCVLRFSRLEDLLNHIVESVPPNKREEAEFTLKTIKLTNTAIVKELFDPEIEQQYQDELAGDWNQFKEVDYCKWILRGTRMLKDSMFLEANRGKQQIAMCLAAIAFVNLYAISKYKPSSVDLILLYGDRIFTATKKRKMRELKMNAKDLSLTNEEIEVMVNCADYEIKDHVKRICIAETLITFAVDEEAIIGDIHSQELENVLDVLRGLTRFFESNRFGIICCKDLSVGVWKLPEVYYMFDANARGPNGTVSPQGVACITRFKELEDLVHIFLQNLPAEDLNTFVIHNVTLTKSECPRVRQPEEKPVPPLKLGGFRQVISGKEILRGELKQDFRKFDRAVHVHSAPVAFVALSMSLVQKPEAWTHLIIDQILLLADELYQDSVARLGFRFNPWTDKIDIYKVNNDFKIGTFKANCELRFTDQKGLVDPKNPKLQNLRQGIERFLEENTHGILLVDNFVIPLWEDEKEDAYAIYMFDPNSRGATGLPMMSGTACALKFCNAKTIADHLISILPGEDKTKLEYQIVPVEIVVGAYSTKRKTKKHLKEEIDQKGLEEVQNDRSKCKSKKVASIEQRVLRKMAEAERRKKEEKREAALGRMEYYKISDDEFVLRGIKTMPCNCDIPSNIASFTMTKICPNLDKWTYKQIEIIMETGSQLYIDSCVAYKLEAGNMDLNYILRKFFMKNIEVHLKIYKPIKSRLFTVQNLLAVLTSYFIQETFCMLNYKNKWVSVFFKKGFFYVFDPYKRSLTGDKADKGYPMMMKCANLERLADKIVGNLQEKEPIEEFYMVLLAITSLVKVESAENL